MLQVVMLGLSIGNCFFFLQKFGYPFHYLNPYPKIWIRIRIVKFDIRNFRISEIQISGFEH
ncbi:hypothetical protein Hanom_Chr02g00128961 [Helianthus anomalus]